MQVRYFAPFVDILVSKRIDEGHTYFRTSGVVEYSYEIYPQVDVSFGKFGRIQIIDYILRTLLDVCR